MNSLPDAAKATLYNLDCTYLTDVQYNRESLDTVTLNFFEEPFRQFPQKFFLMPEGNAFDYRAFIYTLTEDIHSDPGSGDTARYLARAITNDIPEQRKNFRVYVTFQVSVMLKGQKKQIPVTVKDIGTGGFQFVSKQVFEPGTTLTTMFTQARTPVCISACIQKLRPVRREGLNGYGCQFNNLTPNAETLIRNFVFQTEAIQAKAKKEKEM